MKDSNYYLNQKRKLLKDFDKDSRIVKNVLIKHFGEDFTEQVRKEARKEFEDLILRIPYIGGKSNFLTNDLILIAQSLALYKILKYHNKPLKEIVLINLEIGQEKLNATPKIVYKFTRTLISSSLGQYFFKRIIKKQAQRSQRREYPGDWVFEFVEGNSTDFDFGIDYLECGACKLFHQEGADEFTPYICLYDFLSSELTGTGLIRSMTLAEGGKKCDFRFKPGRKPQNRGKMKISDIIPNSSKKVSLPNC